METNGNNAEIKKRNKALKIFLIISFALILFIGVSIVYMLSIKTPNDSEGELFLDNVSSKQTAISCLYDTQFYDKKDRLPVNLLAKAICRNKPFKAGRYVIKAHMPYYKLIRKLQRGEQDPVKITIQNYRTVNDFIEKTEKKFRFSKTELLSALKDKYGEMPQDLFCDIIPDTYEFYWTVKAEDFLKKLSSYAEKWWTKQQDNLTKCNLTKKEVIILASIVNEETRNNAEKPSIAGVYINRLNKGMLLQADPTVKFAVGDFSLRRILGTHLQSDSPFNTYKVKGLPPAPICLPDVSSIKSVLNYQKHSYLYFCAKEDFSGSHNFASTWEEHLANARKYHNALNQRNIK
ncbi:MAG: endolytic transglycosylase MltG [Bacteroidales bacterium]|nr:endolytic transglycosylase MltG [Bacteroidales bacterium]